MSSESIPKFILHFRELDYPEIKNGFKIDISLDNFKIDSFFVIYRYGFDIYKPKHVEITYKGITSLHLFKDHESFIKHILNTFFGSTYSKIEIETFFSLSQSNEFFQKIKKTFYNYYTMNFEKDEISITRKE